MTADPDAILADLVLAALAAEAVLVAGGAVRDGAPPATARLWSLAAGACLGLALRSALRRGPSVARAAWLAAAGAAHALEVRHARAPRGR